MPKAITVQGKIKIIGVNPYLLISVTEVKALRANWRKPMPVIIKINNQSKEWRTNLMPTGKGTFYLYLHGLMRKASQTKVGDQVTVKIKFDDEYKNGPLHPMPKNFLTLLKKDAAALANWEKLSPSRQKEVLRYLDNLKSAEARERNLIRLMESLSGKPTHFMGRNWTNGR